MANCSVCLDGCGFRTRSCPGCGKRKGVMQAAASWSAAQIKLNRCNGVALASQKRREMRRRMKDAA